MPKAMLPVLLFLCCVFMNCTGNKASWAEKLFIKKCLNCHSRSITCLHLGEDKKFWDQTVTRMLRKNNQQVPPEVIETLVDLLSRAQPGAKQICERTGSQS